MLKRDRFGNYIDISVETGDIRSPLPVAAQRIPNVVMPYQRPRAWETLTSIANLPSVGDSGVLAQSRHNRRLFYAARPQTRRQRIRPQQKPIGRGRPESLIRILLRR